MKRQVYFKILIFYLKMKLIKIIQKIICLIKTLFIYYNDNNQELTLKNLYFLDIIKTNHLNYKTKNNYSLIKHNILNDRKDKIKLKNW